MRQSFAAEKASRAFPLPYTLLAKGMQLQFQEAFSFSQLILNVSDEK